MSENKYFKHFPLYKDGRFHRDPRFRYFACNCLLRWQALENANVMVRKNTALVNMNADQIRQALLDNPSLYRKVLCFCSNLRSSRPYWYTRSQELKDMIEQLQSPTFFFTLSAADLQWSELYRLFFELNLSSRTFFFQSYR